MSEHDDDSTGGEKRSTTLAILGSREGLPAGNPIQMRALVNEFHRDHRRAQAREGEDAHDAGTRIVVFFKARADEICGYGDDFVRFLRDELGVSRTAAYRYVRIAKFATAAQSRWGSDAVLAAASLVELLAEVPALRRRVGLTRKPATISDLAKVPFKLPGGRVLKLDTEVVNAPELEEVLDELKPRSGAGRETLAQRRANTRLAEELKANAETQGVRARLRGVGKDEHLEVKVPRGSNLVKIARLLERVLSASET